MRQINLLLIIGLLFISCKTVQPTTQTKAPGISVNKNEDVSSIQGGMWIPSELHGMNENEMKSLGMKMNVDKIYNVDGSSLKDAVAHFGGGCTSEVISPNGLLLTNHHCGYRAIQSHSSVEHDYLKDGFWAYSKVEELPNEGLTATFIKRIDDVTNQVLDGVSDKMDEKMQQSVIDKNINKVIKNAAKESWQDANVKSFYDGNQYFLFITETFKDVRLVGAPPSSIGKFGSDTDNWMWPRHTGDFSMFRIYADSTNRPAEYSKDNVPYKPKHYLPISLDGVQENDFTLVYGFPGRTDEYLPAVGVSQIVNISDPAKIEIRDNALKIVDAYMRKDENIKIKYAAKYASIANYWKKWIGERQGILQTKGIEKKQAQEKEFLKIVAEKKLTAYQNILPEFDSLYKGIRDVSLARDYWIEVAYRNVELLNSSFRIFQVEQAYLKGGELAFENAKQKVLENYSDFYKNYSPVVDKPVFVKLMELYVQHVPEKYIPAGFINDNFEAIADTIYAQSKLTSLEGVKELLSGTPEEVMNKLRADVGFKFGKKLHEVFYSKIEPEFQQKNMKINALQKKYMKALMTVFPKSRMFPDANSTLRVTYGLVKGYEPRDAVYYEPISHLKGVMEKYIPGDYEFDVSEKLIDLYKSKNYGVYGEDGKMSVDFLGTNHTTGGNSGSPAIDAYGNLIGLNFDRVWEGTMSDMNYDPAICRNIMVDIRFVLFVIDKYAGAKNLIDEMTLVHPKK